MESRKTEDLINKVGGRFMLVALMQKRVRELKKGAKPLVEVLPGQSYKHIALSEIAEDKIILEPFEAEKEDYFDIEEDLFDLPD